MKDIQDCTWLKGVTVADPVTTLVLTSHKFYCDFFLYCNLLNTVLLEIKFIIFWYKYNLAFSPGMEVVIIPETTFICELKAGPLHMVVIPPETKIYSNWNVAVRGETNKEDSCIK
jgi:hypothetical protein